MWLERSDRPGGLWGIGLLWAALPWVAASSTGECYFNAKASCEHAGEVFSMGDTWMTSDCYQCVCLDPFGVGCCDHGQRPVDYPEWCEVISKPESCSVAVVMRANHKIPCLEGVGRSGRLRGGDQRPSWKTSNDPLF